MAEEASSDERTYEASDERREKFRKEGRYPRARDAGGLAASAAALLTLYAERRDLDVALRVLFRRTLGDLDGAARVGLLRATFASAEAPLAVIAPVLVSAALSAFAVSFAQAGLRPNPDALEPKLERLDPAAGFRRIFAWKKASVELAFSVLRLGVVAYVGYRAVALEIPLLVSTGRSPLGAGAALAAAAIARVLAALLVALFVLAAAEWVQSRFSLERELKMTLQEKKDETRQQEGDPKAKGRMRARARALARKRVQPRSVKSADVIVTNPTHIAVALRYGPRDPAPVVLAKGHDALALQIRAEGRKYGIPILENRPLARALDAQVRIGQPIPVSLFGPVAQVLAFVYRLKQRGALGGTGRA